METPKKKETARDQRIKEMTDVFFETLRKQKKDGVKFNNNPSGMGSRGHNYDYARGGSRIMRNGKY